MTRAAQVCIDHEESTTDKESPKCADIPEWRRVHTVAFHDWSVSTPTQSATLHLRTRPNGMDGEWWDDMKLIEWESFIPVDTTQTPSTAGQLIEMVNTKNTPDASFCHIARI